MVSVDGFGSGPRTSALWAFPVNLTPSTPALTWRQPDANRGPHRHPSRPRKTVGQGPSDRSPLRVGADPFPGRRDILKIPVISDRGSAHVTHIDPDRASSGAVPSSNRSPYKHSHRNAAAMDRAPQRVRMGGVSCCNPSHVGVVSLAARSRTEIAAGYRGLARQAVEAEPAADDRS